MTLTTRTSAYPAWMDDPIPKWVATRPKTNRPQKMGWSPNWGCPNLLWSNSVVKKVDLEPRWSWRFCGRLGDWIGGICSTWMITPLGKWVSNHPSKPFTTGIALRFWTYCHHHASCLPLLQSSKFWAPAAMPSCNGHRCRASLVCGAVVCHVEMGGWTSVTW